MVQLKTLDSPGCKASLVERIVSLTAGSTRRWGRMSAHQMLCHLTDSFRAVIGEREISRSRRPLPRAVLKWLVLRAPMKWPHNIRTRPEVAQDAGGTPPVEFDRDRQMLLDVMDRFCDTPDDQRGWHPALGLLSHEEWMRWGYLHVDHHLRQFGA